MRYLTLTLLLSACGVDSVATPRALPGDPDPVLDAGDGQVATGDDAGPISVDAGDEDAGMPVPPDAGPVDAGPQCENWNEFAACLEACGNPSVLWLSDGGAGALTIWGPCDDAGVPSWPSYCDSTAWLADAGCYEWPQACLASECPPAMPYPSCGQIACQETCYDAYLGLPAGAPYWDVPPGDIEACQ
jgi:hypothetical protein